MSIARQVTSTFITKIISVVFAFVGSVFLARLLGPEGKGVQAFINASIFLFSFLIGMDMYNSLTYFIAKEKFKGSAVRGFAFFINASGVFLLVVFLYLYYLFSGNFPQIILPTGYNSFLFILYFFTLFLNQVTANYFNGNWQGSAKFEIINFFTVAFSIVNGLLFSGLWFYFEYHPELLNLEKIFKILIILNASFITARTLYFIKMKDRITFDFKDVVKPMIAYCLVGWVTGLLTFILRRVDYWVIQYFSNIEELGYYAIAGGITDILVSLVLPATIVISPYITKSNVEDGLEILGRFSRILSFIMLFVAIFMIIFSSFIITNLYGIEFVKSIRPLQILLIGGYFISIRNSVFIYNVAQDKIKNNLISIVVALIVSLIAAFSLVPKYGILGASIASVIGYLTSSLMVYGLIIKETKKPLYFFLIINASDINFLIHKIKTFQNK